MKKKILTCIALLSFAPLLTQCASQGDINKLNYQLRVVNKKLEDMKMGTVDQMQQRQAASYSQLESLRQEVLVLKGQIEEMGHYNRQLKEQNKELELTLQQSSSTIKEEIEREQSGFLAKTSTIENRLDEVESRLQLHQQLLEKIQEARIRDARLKAEAAAVEAEKARQRAQSSTTVLSSSSGGVLNITAEEKKIVHSSPSSVSSSSPQRSEPAAEKPAAAPQQEGADLLTAGDKAYANGNYEQAYTLYERYAQQNSSGDKAVKARFMMGECLFYQGEYDQAILQYQKVISNHSEHPRAATSLLKQGMAFEKLSDIETAKIIYKKIAAAYPSSPEAATAKERSASLN